jgi:hypothetical protein
MRRRWRDKIYGARESDLAAERLGTYHVVWSLSAAGRKWLAAFDVEPWRRRVDGTVLISARDFDVFVVKVRAAGLIMLGQLRPGLQDREPEPEAEKPLPKMPGIW